VQPISLENSADYKNKTTVGLLNWNNDDLRNYTTLLEGMANAALFNILSM
jgi:hypothetical protein